MKSGDLDRMTRRGGWRQIGMFPLPTGQAYLAEKAIHTPEGCQFETLWAAGRDADWLEIAQVIHFDWESTKDQRRQLALQTATEYLMNRDYRGDPDRQ